MRRVLEMRSTQVAVYMEIGVEALHPVAHQYGWSAHTKHCRGCPLRAPAPDLFPYLSPRRRPHFGPNSRA